MPLTIIIPGARAMILAYIRDKMCVKHDLYTLHVSLSRQGVVQKKTFGGLLYQVL